MIVRQKARFTRTRSLIAYFTKYECKRNTTYKNLLSISFYSIEASIEYQAFFILTFRNFQAEAEYHISRL